MGGGTKLGEEGGVHELGEEGGYMWERMGEGRGGEDEGRELWGRGVRRRGAGLRTTRVREGEGVEATATM